MCSFSVGVPFPWIQPTLGRVVFTIEKKNPCISEPAQFKPLLFKG